MATELGMIVTRRDGSPINLMELNDVIVASPTVHQEIVEELRN